MLRLLFLLTLALVGCQKAVPLATPEAPPQGTTSSGGGESTELEFKLIGRSLVRRFKKLTALPDLDLPRFESVLENARIETTEEKLVKDGRHVDALNFPAESLIELVRPRWNLMSAYQRERLVVHETLGLMGVDDTGYLTTDKLTHALGGAEHLSFRQLVLKGPVADTLVAKFDWTSASIVGVGGGDGVIDKVQFTLAQDHSVPISCEFSGNVLAYWRQPKPLTNIQVTDARCMLNVDGYMEGGSHVTIYVKDKDEASEALWKRLGGTDQQGFSYPSIRGSLEKGQRLLSIELTAVENP